MFAVGAGDAVDRAESAHTVRYNQGAKAVDSRIGIGRVGRIEFVAISNPGRFTPVLQLLHKFEIVIARHTEDVPNTSFLQAAQQEVSYRLVHDAYLLLDAAGVLPVVKQVRGRVREMPEVAELSRAVYREESERTISSVRT